MSSARYVIVLPGDKVEISGKTVCDGNDGGWEGRLMGRQDAVEVGSEYDPGIPHAPVKLMRSIR